MTGSGGLIGSESVSYFVEAGYEVIGIENDMRSYFFGATASTAPRTESLLERYPGSFVSQAIDIRDFDGLNRLFAKQRRDWSSSSTRLLNLRMIGPRRSR